MGRVITGIRTLPHKEKLFWFVFDENEMQKPVWERNPRLVELTVDEARELANKGKIVILV